MYIQGATTGAYTKPNTPKKKKYNKPPSWYTGANNSIAAEAAAKKQHIIEQMRADQGRRYNAGFYRGTNGAYNYPNTYVPSWLNAPMPPRINQPYIPGQGGVGGQRQENGPMASGAVYGDVPVYAQPAVRQPFEPQTVGKTSVRNAPDGFTRQKNNNYSPTSMPIIEREMDWLNQNADSPYLPSWLFDQPPTGGGYDWWGNWGGGGGGGGGYGGYTPDWYTGLYQLNANR